MSEEEKLTKEIEKLKEDIKRLKEEIYALEESPYLPKSIVDLTFSITLDREEIIKNELGKRINEKHSSMYDIKNQIKRYSTIIGLDPDAMRMALTEGLQNIIEHGDGRKAIISFTLKKNEENPYLIMSFKHYTSKFPAYSLAEANLNAMKGDITSEYFDFEDSRGRGEFIMKEIADERKIINGVELLEDGTKKYFFKRILIKYKDPNGPRPVHKFDDIKEYIDKLSPDDVICSFHVDHKDNKVERITVISHKHKVEDVKNLMEKEGFPFESIEYYYRAAFTSFRVEKEISPEALRDLFKQVKSILYEEKEVK